jgi:iron complex outermembrane receptor protein
MEITSSLAMLRAQYRKFQGTQLVGDVPVTVDRSHELFPQAPKLTFGIGATQRVVLPGGELTVHADYAYISARAYYQDTASPLQPPDIKAIYARANEFGLVRAYGLLNGRIAFSLPSPNIEIAFWGRNLTDKQYLNFVSTFYTSFGPAMGYPGEPRTYGLTATYNW